MNGRLCRRTWKLQCWVDILLSLWNYSCKVNAPERHTPSQTCLVSENMRREWSYSILAQPRCCSSFKILFTMVFLFVIVLLPRLLSRILVFDIFVNGKGAWLFHQLCPLCIVSRMSGFCINIVCLRFHLDVWFIVCHKCTSPHHHLPL